MTANRPRQVIIGTHVETKVRPNYHTNGFSKSFKNKIKSKTKSNKVQLVEKLRWSILKLSK